MIMYSDFRDRKTLDELLDNVARSKITNLMLALRQLGGDHTAVICEALRRMKLTDLSFFCNKFAVADLYQQATVLL